MKIKMIKNKNKHEEENELDAEIKSKIGNGPYGDYSST
jgi:hypothetical protein